MNFAYPITARRIGMIKAALTASPLTANGIAAAVFLSSQSALDYVRNLMANEMIHIVDWPYVAPGVRAAVYAWGKGVNKPKPCPQSRAQNERARMKRLRKDPEAYSIYLAKQRARYIKDCAGKKANPWFGALPGAKSIRQEARP